jgi:hypothetical protein
MTDESIKEIREAATALLSAMETCHICQGLIVLDENPTHCEDCSWDCDDHIDPDCVPMAVLHANLKAAIKKLPVA